MEQNKQPMYQAKIVNGETKICKNCQSQIPKNAKICPVCKKKQGSILKWIIIAFLVLAIIGAIFGEKEEDPNQGGQSSAIQQSQDEPTASPELDKSTDETASAEPTILNLTPIELFSQELSAASKYVSYETAENTYNFLIDELGFTSIKYIEKSEVGDIIFIVNGDDFELRITVDDEKIYSVDCGTFKLYDGEKVLITKSGIEDRRLEDKTAYYLMAQEIVSSSLKSPSTAEFPSIVTNNSEIKMQRNGEIVAVQSYVDAQNSFGTMIRSEWVVEFKVLDLSSYSYEVVYINIDGDESGKYIDLNK